MSGVCNKNGHALTTLPILARMRNVEGWLEEEEADLLIATSSSALRNTQAPPALVEVGSYCGRSTIVLGSVVQSFGGSRSRLYAIDPHEGEISGPNGELVSLQSSFDTFQNNIATHGLMQWVVPIRKRSHEVEWREPICYLFIDGLHDYGNVARDFFHFERWLEPGGFAAFHDYSGHFPGVQTFVNELLGGGNYEQIDRAGSLMVLRKRESLPAVSVFDTPVHVKTAMDARCFAVVSDAAYFPGLRALLNSILAYHELEIPVHVYVHQFKQSQLEWLRHHSLRIRVFSVTDLPLPVLGIWEAKQQVFAHCLDWARVVCLLDADLVLTSRLDDVFTLAGEGKIVSSADGSAAMYGPEYSVYDSDLPGRKQAYINSGALCLDVVRHWDLAGLWSFASKYGAYSPGEGAPLGLPGHGDQGVFNAIAARLDKAKYFHVVPEGPWCDSTKGCTLRIRADEQSGRLEVWNETEQTTQRVVHSSGPKWWTEEGVAHLARFGDKLECFHHFAKTEPDNRESPARVEPFGISDRHIGPRILIGICSCQKFGDRRKAVRETWLAEMPAGMNALFFTGDGGSIEEPALVNLPVSDEYGALSRKVHLFYRYVLDNYEFDYLFKCDDDTYVHSARLQRLVNPAVHFLGSKELYEGYASGGAGYLMSRAMVERLVIDPVLPRADEDVVFTQRAIATGMVLKSTELLRGFGDEVPEPDNEIVTGHWCGPFEMRRIHAELTGSPPGRAIVKLRAAHKAWSGWIRLYGDGAFWSQGPANPNGVWTWTRRNELLVLHWEHWPAETLHLRPWGFEGSDLRLELVGAVDGAVAKMLWMFDKAALPQNVRKNS